MIDLDKRRLVPDKWIEIVLTACAVSMVLDPLFLYIPVIDEQRQCLDMDERLKIAACCLRTLIDLIHVIHIIWMLCVGRFYSSWLHLVNDVLSVLPLPQMTVFLVTSNSEANKLAILIQYIPRLIRILPVSKESQIINIQRGWGELALNLFLYFIISHAIGAFWYQFAIDREVRCWHHQCWKDDNCKLEQFYCRESSRSNITFPTCIVHNPDTIDDQNHYYNYGIFYPALSEVATSTNVPLKLLYCFCWALRSLSSLGQNLQPGPFLFEILFIIHICIFALLLFTHLIGNMQKCMETITIKVQEMKARRKHAEKTEQCLSQWSVSDDLQVPFFSWMDTQILDAICKCMKPMLYTHNMSILIEGQPVEDILFIRRGKVMSVNETKSCILTEGDFLEKELISWAFSRHSSSSYLPLSTRTVTTILDVQAFALSASDLRFVLMRFFDNGEQAKHLILVFRCYSYAWRIWASHAYKKHGDDIARRKSKWI